MIDESSIVPNFRRILDEFWAAKLEEGKETGSRTGACSFYGRQRENSSLPTASPGHGRFRLGRVHYRTAGMRR